MQNKLSREEILSYGCKDETDVQQHLKIYDKMKIPDGVLYRFYCTMGMQTELNEKKNRLYVLGEEDQWKIILSNNTENGIQARLFHNDYVNTMSGSRIFMLTYHEERLSKHTLEAALKKITRYSFQKKHLTQSIQDYHIETSSIHA